MALVNSGEMLCQARREGYGVGAFNIVDFLSMEAVVRAAEACSAPAIIQISPATLRRYGPDTLFGWAFALAARSCVPVGLHLDHGTDEAMILACIDSGFTSVMIDASHEPFGENVRRTRAVVLAARRRGVAVEAEIGVLGGVEDDLCVDEGAARYTTPEEALAFQHATGIDFLAPAIGTAHGFYHKAPRLNLDVLRAIHAQADFPLVIHGGTGLSEDTLCTLVACGASKLNLSTQLKKTYLDGLHSYLDGHPGEYNPLAMLNGAQAGLVAMLTRFMRLLGGAGKAVGA